MTPVCSGFLQLLSQPVVIVHLVDPVIPEYIELMLASNPASKTENVPVENHVGYKLS